MGEQTDNLTRVLMAVRLGWLTVEGYGRLRQFLRSEDGRRQKRDDAGSRFDFSERSLTAREAILMSMGQLRRTAADLGPGLPSLSLPAQSEFERVLDTELDLDALHRQLNDWATEVWIALNAQDDAVGRAFTYGGSLADTYWHGEALGPDGFAELLRRQRLEYIAQRFDSISECLPPYVARVLHYTLERWSAEKEVERLDRAGRQKVLQRLESQVKVWHDLLFGGRSAESYLTTNDRRLVGWGAAAATVASLLAAMALVFLSVLALSSAGRNITASVSGISPEVSGASSSFVQDLLDWQKWSTLLATFSSLVVLATGVVTRLSGWMIGFHKMVREWLSLQLIYRRTYRSWER